VIFDRDGTLNHDAGYTHLREDLKWIDGAIEELVRERIAAGDADLHARQHALFAAAATVAASLEQLTYDFRAQIRSDHKPRTTT
jgi:histidinol phosphatase-like enzyme